MADFETLVNLTPHPIMLWRDGAVVATWPAPAPGTPIPRVAEHRRPAPSVRVGGVEVPVVELTPSLELDPVPPRVEGTAYVVSRLAAMAVPNRPDIFFPIEHRDDEGVIVGCSGFARFSTAQEDLT